LIDGASHASLPPGSRPATNAGRPVRVTMATIHDVARRAGVSSATVSHVINNSRFVAPQTRERVMEAIEALRYRRDGVARSLRRAKTSTIGVIIADISNPFFADLVRGIEDRIYGHEEGFNLILCNTDENADKERLYLDVLQEKRIEGLIMVPTGENAAYLEELVRSGLPIVFADRFVEGLAVDRVLVDNEDGGYVLVSHLVAGGHRHIGVLRAHLAANTLERRVDGYRRALGEAGIPYDPAQVISCRHSIEDAHQAGLRILDSKDRPTAVFCTNNYMTLGMVQAITDRGLRCPQDIAVVGFDDFAWAASFSPRLTALAQPAYALGQEAADILMKRIGQGALAAPVQKMLKGSLVIRESGGPSAR
jgi:LacI family transcriptional regulator